MKSRRRKRKPSREDGYASDWKMRILNESELSIITDQVTGKTGTE